MCCNVLSRFFSKKSQDIPPNTKKTLDQLKQHLRDDSDRTTVASSLQPEFPSVPIHVPVLQIAQNPMQTFQSTC